MAPSVGLGLSVALLWCAPLLAQSLSLLPVDDPDATAPLLPAGVSRCAPALCGDYAHVWGESDGTQVVQFFGEFTLHLGDRRLQSQESVIWIQRARWHDLAYYHFEVCLSQQAKVRDSAGTLTSGQMLFVTFNTTEPPVVEADATTDAPGTDSSLYRAALDVRTLVRQGEGADVSPAGLAVLEPGVPRIPPRPEARPVVRHWADDVVVDQHRRLITATGNVYVSQGLIDSGDFMEIRADAAVLFLAEPPPSPAKGVASPNGPVPATEPFPEERPVAESGRTSGEGVAGIGDLGSGVSDAVAGVYLRGDVVLTRGERMIRAAELYYDFENNRALILDAVMRAMAPGRDLPIYVRAEQVRQLSSTEYVAQGALVTTSEFYTPHIHLGAERVHLTDLTSRDESGQITGLMAGRYRMHDVTLNLEGVPLAYWPYTAGDFRQSETAIRSIRTAYRENDGLVFQSKWYLFNLLGVEDPKGVDGVLRLDYMSKRGPGVGVDVDYEQETSYGLFRGYYIHDTGTDNLGPFRDEEPDTENRGRVTWRHRELLGQGWELTLEGSWISDPSFLEEYFEGEFEEGKEQETLAYLKKQQDNWALTALVQYRMLDFLTQTEHWPDLAFRWVGEPLAEIASFYHESHFGFARYLPDNRRLFDKLRIRDNTGRTDLTMRTDTRNEIDLPIKLGSLNLVPYATGRAGYWDGSADDGSRDRLFGSLGMRAGTQFWRLFEDVSSDLLDVHGVRHVIEPQATAWMSQTNSDSIQLSPFQHGVETIDDFYGSSVALRQRWQTKRGGPGNWRVVDWITFDIELNLYGNAPHYMDRTIGRFYDHRPENSIARNHIRTDASYRVSDTTTVLADANFDLNDGSMDMLNVSYAVERSPRLSYFIGYRRIGDTDSNLIGFGANYEIDVKHRVAVRSYYDLDRNNLDQLDVTLVRKFPRWYAALTFGLDRITEDFSVGVSVWPEGAPGAAIGHKRYTSLATSTGIRPED